MAMSESCEASTLHSTFHASALKTPTHILLAKASQMAEPNAKEQELNSAHDKDTSNSTTDE